MKKFAKIGSTILTASLLVACVALWGCQKEVEPSADPAIPTTTQMLVNAGVDKTVAPSKATGIRDDKFKDGDAIGLYVVAYRKPTLEGVLENDGNYVDNAKSTKGSTAWANSPLIYYPTVKVDMYAYYPYDINFRPTTAPAAYEFTVKADQSSETKVTANDFMTAQLLARTTQAAPVDMMFFHRMSKLDVKFTLPASYQGRVINSLQSITFKAFKETAVVDLLTRYKYNIAGQIDADNGVYPKPATPSPTATSTIDIIPNKVSEVSRTFHYEAIVVPQTRALGIGFIEIVVKYNTATTEKFIYVPTADVVFEASRSTLINIEFQPDNTIVLGTVDIKGWDIAPVVPGTGTEREVFNDFTLTLPLPQTTQIKTVDVVVLQGTGNAVTLTYPVPATHTAGGTSLKFAFDGTRTTPDFYPFKIVSVLCRNAAGAALVNVSCANTDVAASGDVALVGTTTLPII